MAKKIVLGFLSLVLISLTNYGTSQFSLGGGVSSYHGLNMPVNRFGLNLFGEFPRTTNNTFMIRASYMFPVKFNTEIELDARDFSVQPQKINSDLTSKTTYFAVDGGTRYYFVNDYDIGFGMYAGGYLKGILSSFSGKITMPSGVDPADYNDEYYYSKGQVFYTENMERKYSVMFAFGGTIGMKYQLPVRGAITLDLGLEFVSRLIDPHAILGNEISQLSFGINLAYRFDWF